MIKTRTEQVKDLEGNVSRYAAHVFVTLGPIFSGYSAKSRHFAMKDAMTQYEKIKR